MPCLHNIFPQEDSSTMKSILFQYPKHSYAVSFVLKMVFREGRQNLSQWVYWDLLFIGAGSSSLSCFHAKNTEQKKNSTWKAAEKSVMRYSRREAADKANPDVQNTRCLTLSCLKQLDLCATYCPLHSLLNNTNSICKF